MVVEQPWRARLESAATRVVKQIVAGYDPKRIILFGSFARGDIHEDSDIDLLIIKETDRRFFERLDDVLTYVEVDVAVEPIVYTPVEWARLIQEGRDFAETILAEGSVVYERSIR